MNISQLYLRARKAIAVTEDAQSAAMLARNLLCKAADMSQEQLLASWDQVADEAIAARLESFVSRILNNEPLAYILGEWEFYGLPLYVNKDVLIPRDDTCAVASLAINQALYLDPSPRILDLCTGSGCIGIALATRVTDARVTLADISPEALAVAKANIKRHRLNARVMCVNADALAQPPSFLGMFDLIVSNPPYITTQEMDALEPSVRNFEPHLALHGGSDGLDFYRSIIENYSCILKPGGYLCFEFGMGQGNAVCQLLKENMYDVADISLDYNNRERAVIAQYRWKED